MKQEGPTANDTPFAAGKATRRIPGDAFNPDGRQMRRYERQMQDAVQGALERLQGDLFDGIGEPDVMTVLARLDSESVTTPFRDRIVAALQRVAIAGAEFGREQIERHVFGTVKQDEPLTIDWTLANNRAARWAQRYGFELVGGLLETTRDRLRTEVASFIQNQESIDDLVGRLSEPGGPFSPQRAELVASTEVTRAFAEGNMASWRESGVIERREWRTSNDEIVCPICGPLAGEVRGLDESFSGGIDNPPAHPRCRCWLVAVVEVPE